MTRKLVLSSSCLIVLLLVVVVGINDVHCDLTLFSSSSPSSSLPSASSGSGSAASSVSNQNNDHLLGDINSDSDSDKYDRLHLFPSSSHGGSDHRLEMGRSSPQETGTQCVNVVGGDKSTICKDYCESLNSPLDTTTKSNDELSTTTNSTDRLASLFIDKLKCRKMIDETQVKLSGVLRYYKSFVHSFVTSIRSREQNEEVAAMIYKLEIEITKHEMDKLASFAITDEGGGGGGGGPDLNETISIDQVHDVTDILKTMLVQVESNRLLTLTERLIEAFQGVDVFNSPFIRSLFAIAAISTCGVIFWRLNKRLPVYKSWRYFLVFVLFALFVISVYNNHIYLAQKKQIYNQQKLKEFVPDECLAKDVPNQENKGAYSKVMSFIKYHIGYTPTSRRCLEYQEALFIVSGHNNYVESIVYTVSESLKPIFISSGEFINQFYGALTKDLSFWQYIPLITLVTIVLLPIGLIFILVMSLVLFGYEFNFFYNLISFRRRSAPVDSTSSDRHEQRAIEDSAAARRQKRDELESILSTIRSESSRLVSNNVTLMISDISCMALQSHLIESSSDSASAANDLDLVPIDVDNSSDALKKNIHTIFTRINSREYELKHQLDNLRVENYALKERLKSKEEETERQRFMGITTRTIRSKPSSSSSSKITATTTTTTATSIEPLDSSHETSESNSDKDNSSNSNESENMNMNNSNESTTTDNGETVVTTTAATSSAATEVAIGLSKTVVKQNPLTSQQHNDQHGGEDEDDDDEIYVILDDN